MIPGFDGVALGKELDLDTLEILQRLVLTTDAQGMLIGVTLRHFKGVLPVRIITRPRFWYAERVKGSDSFNFRAVRWQYSYAGLTRMFFRLIRYGDPGLADPYGVALGIDRG